MKRNMTLALLLCFAKLAISQSTFFQPIQRPLTGWNKITNDNPYIVKQTKSNDGNWVNEMKYYWEPSQRDDFKKYNAQFMWEQNAWVEYYSSKDSLTFESSELRNSFNTTSYNYPGFNYSYQSKYTYKYTSTGKDKEMKLETKEEGQEAFTTYMNLSIHYDNDYRMIDSTLYVQDNLLIITNYIYNQLNQISYAYDIDGKTGDTTGRKYYTYDNGMIQSIYTEYLNTNTLEWIPREADSITYKDGNIVKRITYAMRSQPGGAVLVPYTNDSFVYNDDNTMHLMFSMRWNEEYWEESSKVQFLYKDNGKPLLAFEFDFTGTDYNDQANTQYLFEFLSSTPKIINNSHTLTVYPNPSKDVLNINLPKFKTGTYQIKDISGKTVLSENVTNNINPISLTELCNGIYFITIEADGQTQTTRFVIAK